MLYELYQWYCFNPLKGRDIKWLHFAIQVPIIFNDVQF